ncbi:uncharacterized protein TNCV_3591721 [Trichonephila clavipes]|nr:uncharacterized protein TNCV_3591721 [Trichonephila clavipes]
MCAIYRFLLRKACKRKLLESEATTGFFVLLGTKGKKETLEWCMKANLIASRYECPRCKKEMRLQERNGTVDGYEWRCRSQSKDNPHDVVRSVRKGTWFSKLAITIILRLTRYWFGKSMNAFVVNDDLTVTSWWMTIFMNSLHSSQGCIHQRNMTKCKRKRTEKAIRANRRLKLKGLHQIIPEVSMTTLYEVVTVKLGYSKLCARWVPKMLTEEHKKKRMDFVLDFFTCYAEAGDEFLDHIVQVTRRGFITIHLNPSNNQCNGAIRIHQKPRNAKLRFQQKKHDFCFLGQTRHSSVGIYASRNDN